MASGKKSESSAWAICIAKTGLKPHKAKEDTVANKQDDKKIVTAIGRSLRKSNMEND